MSPLVHWSGHNTNYYMSYWKVWLLGGKLSSVLFALKNSVAEM